MVPFDCKFGIRFLKKNNYLFKDFYMLGEAYYQSYELLMKYIDNTWEIGGQIDDSELPDFSTYEYKPTYENIMIVGYANLSFSCELLLKSILVNERNERPIIHQYYILFNKLRKETQERIRKNTLLKYKEKVYFKSALKNTDKVFEKLRYFYEGNVSVNCTFLVCFCNALLIECENIYNKIGAKNVL